MTIRFRAASVASMALVFGLSMAAAGCGKYSKLATAYFFLGNSYDQLYKPAKQWDPTNDAYIQKAIANYRKAADKNTDKAWKKSSLEYLAAAYGSDKLNDPVKAEPVYQEIIALEPSEPGNYMALAKLYEDDG